MQEGYQVLDSIYRLSSNFAVSKMYPGVPEYINERGRGMYTYLTGSASWLLLTQLTEVYGVKGYYGDLLLEPKLIRTQFDAEGAASVETLFAGRMLEVVYRNPRQIDYGQYRIGAVKINGQQADLKMNGMGCLISRELLDVPEQGNLVIEVLLERIP